jgi:hypothetical protein
MQCWNSNRPTTCEDTRALNGILHQNRQELGPVVTEILCSSNVDVSDLQGLRQMDEDANLEGASAENDGVRPLLDDEALPSVGGKTKIDFFLQIVAALRGGAEPTTARASSRLRS